jgi:predicted Rossmann fold flavoprotein
VRGLAGVSVPRVEIAVPGSRLKSNGALLFTHWGLSGPVILRLSAWGARELHARSYQFPLQIKWLPGSDPEAELKLHTRAHSAKLVVNSPLAPLPQRLWHSLSDLAGIPPDRRWNASTRAEQQRLISVLTATDLPVSGKSLNKDEFVTCGGVRLREVNFKTMESRICPGLYFAGELLDVDGITGGFNFQAAWTTGWIAGQALAGRD